MKTEIFFAKSQNPTVTAKKLQAIQGSGTAFITEKVSQMPDGEFNEVPSFEHLKQAAETGKDVVYKTGTYSGRARFYVQK